MINLNRVNAATDELVAQGVRVLNSFLLADDEAAHAQRLLELMAPPQGAVVLDAGCGVGELARLMLEQRPDLTFKLLNVSQHQLDLCPDGMERICAPYEATGLADGSVDVVLFACSISHADDWGTVLREAHRVLRPGGIVFIFDIARTGEGSNTMLREMLHASAYRPADVLDLAQRCGLELLSPDHAQGHNPAVCRLAQAFGDKADYEVAMRDVFPMTLRLSRMPEAPPIEDAFRRHQRIGFQFSGGRDSWAAAWLLRPWWDRITFYHLDTADHFPETVASVQSFEIMLGRPVQRIHSDVHAVRREQGLASDVVPVDNTLVGRMVSGRTIRIISRYECCAMTLMLPMHRRMLADGITLIIRGQRDDEYAKPPKRSGDVEGPFEALYPIQHMTAKQVDELVARHDLPVPGFYASGMPHGSDCMGCTAWWGEGRAAFMRQHHPQAHEAYVQNMRVVRAEIDHQLAQLDELRG